MVPVVPPPKKEICRSSIILAGPRSPLEIQAYGMTKFTEIKSIKIDSHSVNSILLENEPNDMFEKHLVSVSSYRGSKESEIVIKHTTLMPHIRAFAPLMALLFAPCAQLKKNPKGTHYSLLMTGLGCDANENPIHEVNDMVFQLDAEISNEDLMLVRAQYFLSFVVARKSTKYLFFFILKVNEMRALKNELFALVEHGTGDNDAKAQIIDKLKDHLITWVFLSLNCIYMIV